MTRNAHGSRRALIAVVGIAVMLLAGPAAVGAAKAHVELASPIFGLATAPDGSLLVADAGQGIVAIRKGEMTLAVPLPGVDDVGAIGSGSFLALTGGGGDTTSAKLWRVSNGRVVDVLKSLRHIEGGLKGAQASNRFTNHGDLPIKCQSNVSPS